MWKHWKGWTHRIAIFFDNKPSRFQNEWAPAFQSINPHPPFFLNKILFLFHLNWRHDLLFFSFRERKKKHNFCRWIAKCVECDNSCIFTGHGRKGHYAVLYSLYTFLSYSFRFFFSFVQLVADAALTLLLQESLSLFLSIRQWISFGHLKICFFLRTYTGLSVSFNQECGWTLLHSFLLNWETRRDYRYIYSVFVPFWLFCICSITGRYVFADPTDCSIFEIVCRWNCCLVSPSLIPTRGVTSIVSTQYSSWL